MMSLSISGACNAAARSRAMVLLPVPGYSRITKNVLPVCIVVFSLLQQLRSFMSNALSVYPLFRSLSRTPECSLQDFRIFLRITVRCPVGVLKCWITEEIEQASSTRTGGTRDLLQPGSGDRAMYTPFFFMSQIITQNHAWSP